MRKLTCWMAAGLLAMGLAEAASAERLGTEALAEAIEVAELETYEPGYDSVVTVGIMENTTDRLLERVRIGLIVRDADGEELGRESAEIAILAPGGWAVFRSVFKAPEHPGWHSIEPLVWRAQAHPASAMPSLEATVEREDTDPRSSYIHEVHGNVTNTDNRALEWARVDAAFYDADDRLVAVGHGNTGAELPVGESKAFSIGINTAGGDVARTEVRAYANPVER